MKQYEARVYLGKDTYEKLDFIVKTTGSFSSINQLLGVLLKEQAFTDSLDSMVNLIKLTLEKMGRKEEEDD